MLNYSMKLICCMVQDYLEAKQVFESLDACLQDLNDYHYNDDVNIHERHELEKACIVLRAYFNTNGTEHDLSSLDKIGRKFYEESIVPDCVF